MTARVMHQRRKVAARSFVTAFQLSSPTRASVIKIFLRMFVKEARTGSAGLSKAAAIAPHPKMRWNDDALHVAGKGTRPPRATVETAQVQVATVVNEAVSRARPRAQRIRAHDDWARNATAALLQLGLTPARVADSPLLRHRLRKCAHRDASGDLKLLVLGASMARGNFNCGRNMPCVGDRQDPQRAWPSLLQAMLREALPACNATVELHASGGWTSETAAMRLEQILRKSQVWDAILLDASVNDADISKWGRAEQRREYMTSAAESMVRTGARRAIPVVLIDTVARWVQPLRCVSASRMLSASVYARLAEHHQLPHIDLQGASCGDREPGEIRHWRAGCAAVDAPGATGSCWMHPGPSTHVALAALLVHAFAAIAAAGEERLLPERPPRVGTLQPAFEVASFESDLPPRHREDRPRLRLRPCQHAMHRQDVHDEELRALDRATGLGGLHGSPRQAWLCAARIEARTAGAGPADRLDASLTSLGSTAAQGSPMHRRRREHASPLTCGAQSVRARSSLSTFDPTTPEWATPSCGSARTASTAWCSTRAGARGARKSRRPCFRCAACCQPSGAARRATPSSRMYCTSSCIRRVKVRRLLKRALGAGSASSS